MELSVKLLQFIWRKLAPKEHDDADRALNNTAIELLAADDYKLAERLLDYGINHTGVTSDVMRKMMIVNYANAIKLGGDHTKAEAILASHDWSATNAAFQICVAAIKDDFNAVVKQMESAVRSGEVAEEEFRSWPVFKKARGEKIFQDEFKKIFGRDLISVVSLDNKMDAKMQNDLDVSKANAVEIEADTPEKRTRH